MTGPRAKPAAMRNELEAATETARCAMAETVLADTTVKSALLAAAKRGLRVCVFSPTTPLDMRGTPAADRIEGWAREQSLQVTWTDPAPVLEQGVEVGRSRCLVISWEIPQLPLA